MAEAKSRRVLGLAWFVIAAVLMVMLWGYLEIVYPYQQEQAAIREIERLGGKVAAFPSGGPEWLRDLRDQDWIPGFAGEPLEQLLQRVWYVNLSSTAITGRSPISIAIGRRGFLEENFCGSPEAEAGAGPVVE